MTQDERMRLRCLALREQLAQGWAFFRVSRSDLLWLLDRAEPTLGREREDKHEMPK